GMDDKSQGAVFLCMEAFILTRFFRSGLDIVTAIALLGLSLVTISRLPIFFVPAIFAAIAAQSPYGVAFVGVVLGGIAAAFALYTDATLSVFRVFDRLSSFDALNSGSTLSHLTLIRAAVT